MGFHAVPHGIRAYGESLRQHSEDVDAARRYYNRNSAISWADAGLLQLIHSAHDSTVTEVNVALDRLRPLCLTSAEELGRTADRYASTDADSARRLDAAYPAPAPTFGPTIDDLKPFVGPYLSDPTVELKPPGKPPGFQDPLVVINTISNFLSPSWWINEAIKATTDVNPAEEVANAFAGDWTRFAECSMVHQALGRFMKVLAFDIEQRRRALFNANWTGNAARGASGYFHGLANSVSHQGRCLDELGAHYRTTAQGAWAAATAATDLVHMIFDKLFWIGVEVAAGAVLAETVVGPALFWSIAALQCADVVAEWGRLTKMLNNVQHTIRLAGGSIMATVGALSAPQQHPLPSGGYEYDPPR